jgi:Ca2+-dependent lipid-binding protein
MQRTCSLPLTYIKSRRNTKCSFIFFIHLRVLISQNKMPDGVLEVTIVEGRSLKNGNIIGENDAYVVVYMDKKYKQRTITIKNTNNPVWNEQLRFNIHKGDNTIHFNVYDADLIGKGTIGKSTIKLKQVFENGEFDEWIKLPVHFGLSSSGEIHVIMNFTVSNFQN